MAGGSAEDKNTQYSQDRTQNTYGYNNPILSDQWLNAFKASQGNLNPSGYTADQQKAIDQGLGALGRSDSAVTSTNSGLNDVIDQYGQRAGQLYDLSTTGTHLISSTPQATAGTAMAGAATAGQAAYAGDVTAGTGAQYMGAYADPFLNDVVNTSVNDYNINADRTLNQIRAGRDASGAFGDRSALADAQYRADATRGLGTLVSGLYSQGFNTAAGLGQQDASRKLLADQGNQTARDQINMANAGLLTDVSKLNASNATDVSKYNAGNATDVSKYNTGLLQDTNVANQNAQYKTDSDKLAAIQSMQDNLAAQTNLRQDQLDNVFKGTQIDTDAAQALFTAGQISQAQLNQILQLAQATNGSGFTQNQTTNTTGNENTIDLKTHFGTPG